MRKLLAIFLFGAMATLAACVGPTGPPGIQGVRGPQGQNGEDGLIATVYEVGPVNFTAANNFGEAFSFPSPIFESDKVLTYFLWEINNGDDVWRLMPQTIFVEQGIFLYNYDFTRFDVNIFLEANFPRIQISDIYTRDLIFRIVVVPGDFPNGRVDFNDYDGVMEMLGVKEEDIKKVKPDQ